MKVTSLNVSIPFLFLLLISCTSSPDPEQTSVFQDSDYISAVTNGEISAYGEIGITFKREISIEKQNLTDILSFSPSIRGEADWVNNKTLVFRPNDPLKNGQSFTGEINLQKLFDLSEEQKNYSFGFSVMELDLEIELDGLSPNADNPNVLTIEGTLLTADISRINDVETSIQAYLNGTKLDIFFDGDRLAKKHSFKISGIEKKEEAGRLEITWSGSGFHSKSEGSRSIDIPEIGAFELIQTRIFRDENPRIELVFSYPVDANQNFIGLLALDNGNRLNIIASGNTLIINPRRRVNGEQTLIIDEALRSSTGVKLGTIIRRTVNFFQPKPTISFLGKGVIIPRSKDLHLPFKAVSLGAIDVQITRIFENNIGQFFQDQQINETSGWNLRRVGRPIFNGVVPLSTLGAVDVGEWNNYSLDLSTLIEPEPGAIYQVEIGYRAHHAVYPCEDNSVVNSILDETKVWELDPAQEERYWNSFGNYYTPRGYNWRERENPCTVSYYTGNRRIRKNVFASDLGIIAKKDGQNVTTVLVTDLRDTSPLTGVRVGLYNYQQQEIVAGTTDANGKVALISDQESYYIIAETNDQKGYLRVDDGTSLSLSNFDVSGARSKQGIKGFLYGERGVWRPGDSLFVSFILEDKNGSLPDNHPITFELRNPSGQLVDRETQTNEHNNFYVFKSLTDKQAPTGNWRLQALVGGQAFSKTLKIETVKPNRLKVDMTFAKDAVLARNRTLDATLSSQWLHGAIAKNLKADIEMVLRPTEPNFSKYRGYTFNDETVSFRSNPEMIFEGSLSEKGSVEITHTFTPLEKGPALLRADFNLRVFEPSGSFSIGRASTKVYPFRTLIGIKPPESDNDRYGTWLNRDQMHTFNVVSVDGEGNPIGRRELEYEIYQIRWRWWWEKSRENLSNYFERENVRRIASGKVTTRSNGENAIQLKLPENADGGRYLIRVKDPSGNHSSSTVVYFNWGSRNNTSTSPSQLTLESDKESYETGDPITLSIPSNENSKLLISLESGSKVLETVWLDGEAEETSFTFLADERMSPNIYAHVMLIQPHGQDQNDLPMRMYGVIPINVKNPETILEPKLMVADEFQPETTTTISVSESNGKAMTYTLAIVDDGLLDLTNFKTPDPHSSFYAREALGIKTWDLYGFVASGFSGAISKILSVGGDGEEKAADPLNEANRFEPMVRFAGPFYLNAGTTNTHSISIPNYVGSVRTMVIAGQEGSYGRTEKTTPVRKPVMVLATLPRVLGPAETVELPVSVFAMKNSIKHVQIEVETNDLFEITGSTSTSVSFDQPGDQIVSFSLKTKPKIGVGKVRVTAKSGNETAYHEIEIAVRNPNTPFTNVVSKNLDAGERWEIPMDLQGMIGTNTATLELSRIPPIDFGKRLNYLIQYPHGCIEQTTSAVFAQLLAGEVVELTNEQKKNISDHMEEGIERIALFLTPTGGLAYWPGQEDAHSWGTSYAYHFLIEAQNRGYYVSSSLLNSINSYQEKMAERWQPSEYRRADLTQAYRLYTLALAGNPELGAMNRFREREQLSIQARWRLAASYALIGQIEAAAEIVAGATQKVDAYTELSGNFGSSLRDQAMILETLSLLQRQEDATNLSREIALSLSSGNWYSTQTTAYSLIAMSKFLDLFDISGKIDATFSLDSGNENAIQSSAYIRQLPLAIKEGQENTLILNNNSSGTLFTRLILEGTPLIGDTISASNNLVKRVRYLTLDGAPIEPSNIDQGSDLIIEIEIKNPGLRGNYEEMALTTIFPSGWEIRNTRMESEAFQTTTSHFDYQDIRDDRVYTYFDLSANSNKVFRFQVNASYEGRFYLPAITAYAMYDETINARNPGEWVTISGPSE
jgi:uncharacterized protein YfaS (alpha-2-macroglobulin family)